MKQFSLGRLPRFSDQTRKWFHVGGIFAPTARHFLGFDRMGLHLENNRRPPCSMTQKGYAVYVPKSDINKNGTALLRLHCGRYSDSGSSLESVHIKLVQEELPTGLRYMRADIYSTVYGKPLSESDKFDTCIYIEPEP